MPEEIKPINIFDSTFDRLQIAMMNATRKQEVISHNIANMGTPGFEPLDFDEVLGKAVKRADGKGVVLEEEMARLAENSIRYSTYVKLLAQKINVLRTIATQGRK